MTRDELIRAVIEAMDALGYVSFDDLPTDDDSEPED